MADAHLPDDELLAWVEQQAREQARGEARDHLAACASCRERVEAYRAAAAVVGCAEVASRAWCPPREALLGFAPDLGEPPPSAQLRAHVAACPACREDVRDLVALDVTAPPLLGALRARVTVLVERLGDALGRGLRLLESSLELAPAPAPALARGAGPGAARADAVAVVAPLGPGELEVTWVASADGVDVRTRARGEAPRAYRLDLATPEGADAWRLVESRSADEAGELTISGLAPGRYLLSVFGPQRGAPDLTLELELRA